MTDELWAQIHLLAAEGIDAFDGLLSADEDDAIVLLNSLTDIVAKLGDIVAVNIEIPRAVEMIDEARDLLKM